MTDFNDLVDMENRLVSFKYRVVRGDMDTFRFQLMLGIYTLYPNKKRPPIR